MTSLTSLAIVSPAQHAEVLLSQPQLYELTRPRGFRFTATVSQELELEVTLD
jgi:hypothetical protein